MIGSFDGLEEYVGAGGTRPTMRPLYRRLGGYLIGNRPPLYRDAGLHLKLPQAGNTLVYIRKNGSSSFRRWMEFEMAEGQEIRFDLKSIQKKYAVTFETELVGVRRILVLRDPIDRLCSLFRNKFIQESGAHDIFHNLEKLSGIQRLDLTFRQFIIGYVSRFLHVTSKGLPIIDPHCTLQCSHLWPIKYDCVIMLKDLTKHAPALFGEAVARKFFTARENMTSGHLSYQPAADISAKILRRQYREDGILPATESFLDEELVLLISQIYKHDYELIAASFAETQIKQVLMAGSGVPND